ncbi:3-oxoacyl-[acyl-carrier-protein] synthase 2 [Phycisphaerales bacterium]|nr:3-oxoacyl-[acyl-carrier-protein] synthase 2 [Phycisphaerales bacterium]
MSDGTDAIAITGLGLVTALGDTPQATFDAILAGQSGLGPVPAMEQHTLATKGGGQAVDLPPPRRPLPREARYLQFAISRALQSASLPAGAAVGAVMGTTLHGMPAAGRALRTGNLGELKSFPALAVLAEATRDLGIHGPLLSTCSACSSGLGAVALAVTLLRSGLIDVVVAGGYDVLSEYAYAGFDSLRLIAPGPPRPFGARREGMKTSEGFAAIVLERASHAQQRGAPPRGYIAGFGESSDAHHLTQPHPEGAGAAAAMLAAMSMAGVTPDDIGLISAHATSTPNNDASEYAAMAAAFGPALEHTPVVAFKSHFGHTLGGAGAVELVLSIIARERGVVPPTLNSDPIDAAFKFLKLGRSSPPQGIRATINTSLGFGGTNASVVTTSSPPRPRRIDARPDRDPVITGIGVVLPGAIGIAAFARVLRSCGAIPAGPIPQSQIDHLVNARRTRRMSDYSKLTLAATADAYQTAAITPGPHDHAACVILGTNHGSSNFCEQFYSQVVREGLGAGNPSLFAEGVPNAAAAQLSLSLGLRGGCQSIIGSRTAGLDALALAALRIRQGVCDRVIVGAAEEYCETVNQAHERCAAHAETFASGAVSVIVESRAAALRRAAPVLASVGLAHWHSGNPARAFAEVLRSVQGPLFSALGDSPADAACRALIDRAGRATTDLRPAIPELFSVGPLAALIAGLASREATIEPFAVVAADAFGSAAGIEIRPESTRRDPVGST